MAVFGPGSRPLRAALCWQFIATAIIAAVAAPLLGVHGAVSAALGGGAIIVANGAYALVVGLSAPRSVGATVRTLLRAETAKIALIVLELWLVFSLYREVVPLVFMGAFAVAVLLLPVALLYRD